MKQVLRFLFLIPIWLHSSFLPYFVQSNNMCPLSILVFLRVYTLYHNEKQTWYKADSKLWINMVQESLHKTILLWAPQSPFTKMCNCVFQFWGTWWKILGCFCMSGIFWMKRDSLRCLLTKILRTGRQFFVLISNEMKAQNPHLSIAEPMATVDLLETSKREVLQMQLQISAHFEI